MSNTVLISGASRGIGRAAALAFAKSGYKVGVNYNRSKADALSLIAQIAALGGQAEAVQADVSDYGAAQSLVDQISHKLGCIDVLINNAGISCDKLFTDTTPADWADVFAVNVTGAYNCIRHVLPQMLSAKHGCIINVSSIWGLVGGSCEVAYSASKAALIGLTKALAKEVGPSAIRVNCVAPGVIYTDMNAQLSKQDLLELKAQTPLQCLGTPQDVAELLLFLASPGAAFITGQVVSPNGGFVI
ncbi:MAG: 3-oxoacyl-ACP reductase FabG [Clostridia bacterium]